MGVRGQMEGGGQMAMETYRGLQEYKSGLVLHRIGEGWDSRTLRRVGQANTRGE